MDAKVAARIESLKHSPAWDDLTAELQAQEDKFWTRHIADLKDPKRGVKALDLIELQRALGKLDGIRSLLAAPEKAAKILERHDENNSEETS